MSEGASSGVMREALGHRVNIAWLGIEGDGVSAVGVGGWVMASSDETADKRERKIKSTLGKWMVQGNVRTAK